MMLVTRWSRLALYLPMLVGVLFVLGCGKPTTTLDTTYGELRGPSVNGLGVLGGMFEEAGHDVTSWDRWSPKVNKVDVIVWAPDNFAPPDEREREAIEAWLAEDFDRTFIYIGRDFDAEPFYWRSIKASAPADQQPEIQRREAKATAQHQQQRLQAPAEAYCEWFTFRRLDAQQPVQEVESIFGGEIGIDESNVQIETSSRLDIPVEGDAKKPLVYDDDYYIQPHLFALDEDSERHAIITQVERGEWGDSKIILVENGSSVLNLPLVNHENRKIAGHLIDQCGDDKSVIFLESDASGLKIEEHDPVYPTGMEAFTVWPLNIILLHLMALGILFCFAWFPIFGRPREGETETVSRFDKHVEALGELFARSGAMTYAKNRVNHYQQNVRRDSGASHGDSA